MLPTSASSKNVLDTDIVWIYIVYLPSLPFLETTPEFLYLLREFMVHLVSPSKVDSTNDSKYHLHI